MLFEQWIYNESIEALPTYPALAQFEHLYNLQEFQPTDLL